MMNVFISHSAKDARIAEELAQALRHHDIHPWLDMEELAVGAPWKDMVEKATARADGFVFVLGGGSGLDHKQAFEWRSALRSQWDSGAASR